MTKFESLITWLNIKETNKNFVDLLKIGTKNKKRYLNFKEGLINTCSIFKNLIVFKTQDFNTKTVEDIFTGDRLSLLADIAIVKRESKNVLSDHNTWNERTDLPLLILGALKTFSICPSTASVERSFSFLNKILSDECHSYNWETIKVKMMARYNYNFFVNYSNSI